MFQNNNLNNIVCIKENLFCKEKNVCINISNNDNYVKKTKNINKCKNFFCHSYQSILPFLPTLSVFLFYIFSSFCLVSYLLPYLLIKKTITIFTYNTIFFVYKYSLLFAYFFCLVKLGSVFIKINNQLDRLYMKKFIL